MSTPAAIDLGALFDGAARSVVRVETLPAYDVPADDESFRAWREGRPRPERSVRTNRYLRRVAAAVARGVAWERLRVIDTPPTDYQRWELLSYVEGQAVGESVTIALRGDMPWDPTDDIWIVDGVAVVQDYDLGGRFLGRRQLDDPSPALHVAEHIRSAGMPLNAYLAAVPAARRAS
jgi:hypothetical protein